MMLRSLRIRFWGLVMGDMLGELLPFLFSFWKRWDCWGWCVDFADGGGSPGRWFANQVLTLLIAYVTVHYEIEPIGERPGSTVFGDLSVPTLSKTMRVRRRKVAKA